jgi:hypothetical protein
MSNQNVIEEWADRNGIRLRTYPRVTPVEPPVSEDTLDIQGVLLPTKEPQEKVVKPMAKSTSEVVVAEEWQEPVQTPAQPSTLEDDRKRKYEEQERKRAPKVQVDQRVVLLTWISSVVIAFVTSAVVSFNGITSVAFFVGLTQEWMASLFFFFVELMYLIFLVAYLILASRVDENGKPEKTAGAIWGMIFFAGVAVAANGFHTLDYWEWNFTEPRAWAGFVLSIAAPIAIISASKMASRVVFARALQQG